MARWTGLRRASGTARTRELLVGVAEREGAESADRFTARCLGAADCGHLLDEERVLNPVSRLTTALVLAQWIEEHEPVCEIGPDTSGSDIREIVRRAVLSGIDGNVSTATLLSEVGNGRYRAQPPAGMYL